MIARSSFKSLTKKKNRELVLVDLLTCLALRFFSRLALRAFTLRWGLWELDRLSLTVPLSLCLRPPRVFLQSADPGI